MALQPDRHGSDTEEGPATRNPLLERNWRLFARFFLVPSRVNELSHFKNYETDRPQLQWSAVFSFRSANEMTTILIGSGWAFALSSCYWLPLLVVRWRSDNSTD